MTSAFAIGSGLRAGELAALHTADVRADHVIVRYGAPPNEPTKTGRIRRVPLLPLAREALASSSPAGGIAFPRVRGGYRDPAHVVRWDAWRAAVDAVGRPVRWHDLRHTFASCLASGVWGRRWSLEELREVLGHTSITTTQRYAHVASDAIAQAARETSGGAGIIGHTTATAKTEGLAMHSESLGALGASRTHDLRLRKPSVSAEVSRASAANGRELAEAVLRAAADGDSARALTLALDLAEAVIAAGGDAKAVAT